METRLKDVEREGTNIRDEIKDARDAFLAVKKKRYVGTCGGNRVGYANSECGV